MKRSVLIPFAAVILGLLSLVFFLVAWQAHYLGYPPATIAAQAMWGVLLGIVAAGLFARKKWARYTTIVLSAFGLAASAAGLLHERTALSAASQPGSIVMGLVAALGSAGFLILFLSPIARDEFSDSGPLAVREERRARRPWMLNTAGVLLALAAIGTLLTPIANQELEPASALKAVVPLAAALLVLVRRPAAYWVTMVLAFLWLAELFLMLPQFSAVDPGNQSMLLFLFSLDFFWRAAPPLMVYLKKSWYRGAPA